MENDIIVYDIETKESFAQIGSRDPKKLHISMLGMYSYKENEYYGYDENDLHLFWRRLEHCDLLIGYNNHGFDDQVVSVYFPEITKIKSLDLLEEISNSLGFRIKLDSIAHATLGIGKSGDGLKAIELYKDGKIEELRSYCLDDVKITKEIYEYGKKNGSLKYSDMQGEKQFFVNFEPEIEEPESALNLSLF